MRPSKDQYFMEIAQVAATRSTCNRAHVGAVLVSGDRVVATGYNGSVQGQEHCDEAGHVLENGHCIRTIHAEVNTVIQCAIHGVSSRGTTCYVTHLPCVGCCKVLLNAGIARIVFLHDYGKSASLLASLFDSGFPLERFQYDIS